MVAGVPPDARSGKCGAREAYGNALIENSVGSDCTAKSQGARMGASADMIWEKCVYGFGGLDKAFTDREMRSGVSPSSCQLRPIGRWA